MKRTFLIVTIVTVMLAGFNQCKLKRNSKIDYLGQTPPEDKPILFAPGIVSTAHFEHSSPTISPDGKEIYWSRVELPLSRESLHKIIYVKKVGDQWTNPEVASFSGINVDDNPSFSSDGNRIYFYSRKPYTDANNSMSLHDIFYSERTKNEWSDPIKLSSVINTPEIESGPSLTKEGDIFFSRGSIFYFANKKEDTYTEPIAVLNDTLNNKFLNITPFINAEGTVLLFGSVNRPDGFGASDLYVSFKQKDGNWSCPKNLGEKVNTGSNERFPSLSPDGKYLFFVSNRSKEENIRSEILPENGLGDIYWVDAKFIEELKTDI